MAVFVSRNESSDRLLADLLADGIIGRVSHGIAHLPSSQRYHLTTSGIGEAARVSTSSDYVRVMDQRLCQWLLCQANSYPVR